MSKRAYKLQEFVAHSSNVNCLTIGKKSSRLLVTGGEDQKVNMWAIGKPNAVLSLSGHTSAVESVTFDTAEVLVLAGAASGTIKLWDLEEAKIVRTLTGHRSNCVSVSFHPFGEFFASGSLDTNLKIWDIRRKGCFQTFKGHTRGIKAIKFSPDGRWVVSGGEDNVVKLWDLTAGKLMHDFKFHEGQIQCLDFHPHEFLLATGSADKTVKFWDLETFESIGSTGPEQGTAVRAMTFSPDGRSLLCAMQDSLKVLSWEPVRCHDVVDVEWSKLADLSVHEGTLIGCSFQQSWVGVWVVDLMRVSPFQPGHTSRPANAVSGKNSTNGHQGSQHAPVNPPTGSVKSNGIRSSIVFFHILRNFTENLSLGYNTQETLTSWLISIDHTKSIETAFLGEMDWPNETNVYTLRQEKSREGGDGSKFTSTPERQEPHIRPEIRSAGFASWDQDFNAGQVLFLCDATTSRDEIQFIFFHEGGMATLFGVGIRHSKASIALCKAEAVIEEITEDSWKSFWTSSDEGSFLTFLYEKSGSRRDAFPSQAYGLTKDQALSKFGMWVDGQQIQEFVKMSKSLSPGPDGSSPTANLEWLISLTRALSSLPGSQQNGLQNHEHKVAIGDQTFGSSPAIASAEAEKPKPKRLVVHVEFLPPLDCALYRWSDKERRERLTLPRGISSIHPKLKVVFTRDSEGNHIDTTLKCKYEIGHQGEIDWPDGWHQNNLVFSFQSSEDGSECCLRETKVTSDCTWEDVEISTASEKKASTQREISVQGSFNVASAVGVQVNGKGGNANEHSNSHQRKLKSRRRLVLADRQSFCIEEKTVHESALMQFRAFDMDPPNALEGEGSQSTVGMEVEGNWSLYGEDHHQYELKASKELYTRTSSSIAPLPISVEASSSTSPAQPNCAESRSSKSGAEYRNIKPWITSDCAWRSDSTDFGGLEVSRRRLIQVFSRKFILNHNFSEFFGALEKDSDYNWRQVGNGNVGNPVQVALQASQ